jgi:zinc transport system ATP-binding protein
MTKLEFPMANAESDIPAITLRGVGFSYGGPPVLEDVNLSIGQREAVCMVGPNGGGKTTLVKLILGLLAPTRGEVRMFGQLPQRSRLRAGYMPQHAQLDPQFPMSVMDLVLMGRLGNGQGGMGLQPAIEAAGPRGTGFRPLIEAAGRCGQWLARWTGWHTPADRRAALEALDQVGMADFWRQPFASLSGGQRQRVLIARALCCQPDLLVLDEPTSNVDSVVEARLLEVLRTLNRHMTILMVSHDLGFVSGLVESVICVNRRVAAHPASRLTGEIMSALYGAERRIVLHDETLADDAEPEVRGRGPSHPNFD